MTRKETQKIESSPLQKNPKNHRVVWEFLYKKEDEAFIFIFIFFIFRY